MVLFVVVRALVVVGLWSLKVGSQKIVRFWLKDHHAQRKFLYLVNRHNTHTQDTIQDTLYKKLFWSCLSLRQNLTDFWLPNLMFHNQTDAFTYMYVILRLIYDECFSISAFLEFGQAKSWKQKSSFNRCDQKVVNFSIYQKCRYILYNTNFYAQTLGGLETNITFCS